MRAMLDMVNNKLYLCGQGQIRFTPPPGTLTFNLVESKSGHVLLPFSEFLENAKYHDKNFAFPSVLNPE
eukprot:6875819-Karenia_brevis.AAC.1